MIKKIEELTVQALEKIKNAKNQNDLNEAKSHFLGKKSPLQEIMSKMREYSVDLKKEIGQKANEFKTFIETKISERAEQIAIEVATKKMESDRLDVTLPGKEIPTGNAHVLAKTIEQLEDIFIEMGYSVVEGPEVEEDLYNFEMMNLPQDHPARDMQDSFYINPNRLLRTHTSPVQARTMVKSNGKPIKMVCPGKVYRRDYDDATHSHQFMQLEGLVVDKNITMADLKGTLTHLMQKVLGKDVQIRFRPSYFPFTEPSVEVDVTCFKCGGKGCPLCKGSGWIELLGAGMVHPNVLKMGGYDPDVYQGFAFGLGIERITMFEYEIDDIRTFYINDPRFLRQF